MMDLRVAGKSPRTLTAYGRAANGYLALSNGDVSRRTLRDWLASNEGAAPDRRRSIWPPSAGS